MAGDTPQFDPTQKGAALFEPLFAANRLVMFGENDHNDLFGIYVHFAAIEAMQKRLEELHKTTPNARAAYFYELPPDKGDAQKLINNFTRSGKPSDLDPHFTAPEKQELVALLKMAQRAGITVFFVDDEESRKQLASAKQQKDQARAEVESLRVKADELGKQLLSLSGTDREHALKQFQETYLSVGAVIQKAKTANNAYADLFETTMQKRNEVMAERIATITNGTNNEAYYKDMIPKEGFDFAGAQNGVGHLETLSDMDELIAQRMGGNPSIYTIELNSMPFRPDMSAITTNVEAYTLRDASGKPVFASPDKPDLSLNMERVADWLVEQKETAPQKTAPSPPSLPENPQNPSPSYTPPVVKPPPGPTTGSASVPR
jgi:hypothetical protein